jgi:3D-(3,5/4)-trihydroxycyclohexane-1,2-dione acylhydrolase (decyclizing)
MPGDLHRLWRTRDPKGYHMEYGYSCMGYEVAGALGAKLADPAREIYAMVGDGSWLMMSQEIMTSVQEHLKLTVVLVDNHGFGSIGALSHALGSQGFGTRFEHRGADGRLGGERIPIDLAANARSLGAEVIVARSAPELRDALAAARDLTATVVIYVEVDPKGRFGGSGAWWDVPVAETSELESTRAARQAYEQMLPAERQHLAVD